MRSRRLAAAVLAALCLCSCGQEGSGVGPSLAAASDTTAPPPSSDPPSTEPPSSYRPSDDPPVGPGTDVDLDRVAQIFLRFARGELAAPPSATPVAVYLGGVLVRTIAGPDQTDRSQWEGLCPSDGLYYASRTCPFSVLHPLRDDGDLRIIPGPAQMSCAHPVPLAAGDAGATHVVTLVPHPRGSCVDWVGVELYVNDVGQVVAVDLVWADP